MQLNRRLLREVSLMTKLAPHRSTDRTDHCHSLTRVNLSNRLRREDWWETRWYVEHDWSFARRRQDYLVSWTSRASLECSNQSAITIRARCGSWNHRLVYSHRNHHRWCNQEHNWDRCKSKHRSFDRMRTRDDVYLGSSVFIPYLPKRMDSTCSKASHTWVLSNISGAFVQGHGLTTRISLKEKTYHDGSHQEIRSQLKIRPLHRRVDCVLVNLSAVDELWRIGWINPEFFFEILINSL